jgi:transposase
MAPQTKTEVRNMLVQYYTKVAKFNKFEVIKKFCDTTLEKRTIYRILHTFDETNSSLARPRPGIERRVATKKVQEKVRRKFVVDPNLSVRVVGQKIGINFSTVQRIKVKDLKIKAYTKKSAPLYKNGQELRAKTNCRKIYQNKVLSHPGTIIVMDDESYFPQNPENLPGRQFYHSAQRSKTETTKKVKKREKFFKKYLVWQAIDEEGNLSDAFISEGTMNRDIYLKECIKKILIPFINKRQVLFWPDMATCHYKKVVVEALKDANIRFVGQKENAPNVPIARPIEKFWAEMKKAYKARTKPAKSLSSFKRIYRNMCKNFSKNTAQALMRQARRNLRLIGYEGVLAPYKNS